MKKERRVSNNTKDKKPKIFLLLSAGFLIFIAVISFLREGGILKVWKLDKELKILKREAIHLMRENRRLESTVIGFKNDDSHIERIAREELGLVKANEIVYKFIR